MNRFVSRGLVLGLHLSIALAGITALRAQTTTPADDHGNVPTAATAITLPGSPTGTLERAGDLDFFKFSLSAPAVVTITSGGTTDVAGRLFLGGAKGAVTELLMDNDGAGAPNFRVSQLLPAGTHYLGVFPWVYGTLGAYSLNFAAEAPSAAQPDITLGFAGGNLPAGTLVDFGTAAPGGIVTNDFVVGNVGDAPLRVYGVRFSLSGALAAGTSFPFRLLAAPAPSVEPGRQTSFRIGFQSNVAGTYNGKATVVSSDGDEIFYEFPIRGVSSGPLPPSEIVVRNESTEVPNNGSINLGATPVGTRLIKTVTIANTGPGELKITGSSLVPATANVAGNTVPMAFSIYQSTIPTAIPAGGQATFQISLYNLVAGSYAAKLTLFNNDGDENPTIIQFAGSVTPDPVQGEIALALNGADLPNNSTVSYANQPTGVGTTKEFVISNPGTSELKLTSWQLVTPAPVIIPVPTSTTMGSATATITSGSSLAAGMGVAGPFPAGTSIAAISGTSITFSAAATATISNASLTYFPGGPSVTVNAFRFESALPATLPAGGSATVKATYLPMQAGTHTSVLKIYNNDADENPFSVTLTGRADINPNPADIAITLNGNNLAQESTVDWGSTPIGTTVAKTFLVSNTGGSELRITGYQAAPVQPVLTTTAPPSFYFGGTPASVLPAGQSGFLTLNFKPVTADTVYKSTLILSSSDPDETPYRINLTGTGVVNSNPIPDIDILVNNLPVAANGTFDFGSGNSGSLVQKLLVVRNFGAAPLTVTGISVDQPASAQQPFGVNVTLPLTIPAGGNFGTFLSFAPTVAGTHSGRIQVLTNDPDESPYTFNVTGTAIGSVASPEIAIAHNGNDVAIGANIAFGAIATGTTVSKQFTVTNRGDAPLTLSGWGLAWPPGSTVSASGTCAMGSSTVTVLNATGLVPGMAVAGPFPAGTSITAVNGTTVTLSAAALSSLTNSYITFFQPGVAPISPFRFEGTLPASVAPGASATFSVLYAPPVAGTHSMTVRLSNNDLSENPYQFTLSGSASGIAPAPEIEVSLAGADLPSGGGISFGSTPVGTTVSKQLVIANSGNAPLSLSNYGFFLTTPGVSAVTSTVSGSPVATVTTATALTPGMVVTGPFPVGTSIVSISGTNVTFSAPASSTATNLYLTFYPAGTNTVNPFRFDGALPTSVAPGASANLTLTYAPPALGSHGLILRFSTNDANENPYQINLTGTAQANPNVPDIAVFSGTVEQARNSTVDFGTIPRGTTAAKEFVIRNAGSASLAFSNLILPVSPVPAPSVSVFTVQIVSGTTPVVPGGSVTVRVTFKPGALSTTYSSVYNINSNDPDENPYGLTLTGASLSTDSEIGVSYEGADLPPLGTIAFGSAVPVGSIVSKTFSISNSGNAPLAISGWSLQPATAISTGTASPPPALAYYLGSFPTSVAAGATVNVSIFYRPIVSSTDNYVLTLNNSDADEGAYKINLAGAAVPSPNPPEVALSIGGTEIPNGGSLALSTAVNVAVTKDILITNTGAGELRIAAYWTQNTAPAGSNAITTTQAPPGVIAPGASGVWKIKFQPNAAGAGFSAKLTLHNSDPDESAYVVNVTGSTTP